MTLTLEQIDAIQRIGRDKAGDRTTIGLVELDALCEMARRSAVSSSVLGAFFGLVKETDRASDRVDLFDLHSDVPSSHMEFKSRLAIQHNAVVRLLEFCGDHKEEILRALSRYDGLGG